MYPPRAAEPSGQPDPPLQDAFGPAGRGELPAAADAAGASPLDDATAIRLSALEERVRLLEVSTQRAGPGAGPVVAGVADPGTARSARGVVAARLAALGHPSRLELLAGVVRGATTTNELSAGLGTGSTGQLYHHLNQLVAAGWLRTTGRGRYEIPVDRRAALTTILALVDPATTPAASR